MADIKIEDITTGEINGTGVFDKLMLTMDARLQEEYSKQRLKGSDYAKVYLGSMDSVISQSMQFVLGEQQADKQADLLAAQTLNVAKEGLVLDQEVLLKEAQVRKMDQDVINSVFEGQILSHQIDKIAAEIRLLDRQGDIAEVELQIKLANLANADAERLLILAKTDLTNSQTEKVNYEYQSLMPQQVINMAEEKKLITSKDASEKLIGGLNGKISKEILLLNEKIDTEVEQEKVLVAQENKIDAEKLLIEEKRWTEKAQYSDTTGNPNAAVQGVIGKQKELYTAQKNGFARDAEQKATKMMLDTWNVAKSAEPIGTTANPQNKLQDIEIGKFVTKLASNIGVTV